MENSKFIQVQVTVDYDLPNGSLELTNTEYFWLDMVKIEPEYNYKDVVPMLKALEKNGRLKMVTIDVLSGGTQQNHKLNLYSLRLIERGGAFRMARLENDRYDFDSDTAETDKTPAQFVTEYGKYACQQAMYNYIDAIKKHIPQ